MKRTFNRNIIAAAGVITLLLAGLVYAWSVLSAPIAAEFPDWSRASLSFTFTLCMSFFCLGGLVGGIVSKKLPVAVNLLAAAVLFFIGFRITSGITSLTGLYIGFGILSGFASGLAYNAVMGSVMGWFTDVQGLISGILLMGFGISSFLVGKIYTALLPSMGWRAEFKAFSWILLVLIALSALVIQKPEPKAKAAGGTGGYSSAEMLKEKSFWIYAVWTILLSSTGLAFIAQASGILHEASPNVTASTAATVIGLISIFNGIGRVIFGGLFDKIGYRKNMLFDCVLYIAALALAILGLKSGSFLIVVLAFIAFGLAYGGVTPLNSAVISSFFGTENYAVNFSIINLTLIVSSFGGTLAGLIYDKTGSYMTMLICFTVIVVLGILASLALKKPEKKA